MILNVNKRPNTKTMENIKNIIRYLKCHYYLLDNNS